MVYYLLLKFIQTDKQASCQLPPVIHSCLSLLTQRRLNKMQIPLWRACFMPLMAFLWALCKKKEKEIPLSLPKLQIIYFSSKWVKAGSEKAKCAPLNSWGRSPRHSFKRLKKRRQQTFLRYLRIKPARACNFSSWRLTRGSTWVTFFPPNAEGN